MFRHKSKEPRNSRIVKGYPNRKQVNMIPDPNIYQICKRYRYFYVLTFDMEMETLTIRHWLQIVAYGFF